MTPRCRNKQTKSAGAFTPALFYFARYKTNVFITTMLAITPASVFWSLANNAATAEEKIKISRSNRGIVSNRKGAIGAPHSPHTKIIIK